MTPKVLIMSGYGINCEAETAHGFELVRAAPEIVHINDLISGRKKMSNYDIMVFPGGFSYGDDTGSGNAFANRLKNNLWGELLDFIKSGKLVLGICNGFQIMLHLGLFNLPGVDYGKPIGALLANNSNRYECRWVRIKHVNSKSVFTKGIEITHLPVAHGEGRFYCNQTILKKIQKNGQIVFTYCDNLGKAAKGKYPLNPNGAMADVAGICDRSGRIMGMMPHPERALYSLSEPEFHLKKEIMKRKGKKVPKYLASNLVIFKNAVGFFK